MPVPTSLNNLDPAASAGFLLNLLASAANGNDVSSIVPELIQSDVNNTDPEVVAAAVRFLSCLPATELASRLVIGDLSELLTPCLAAEAAVVRSAAVQTLSSALMQREVQEAASSSPGLANAYEGLWDAVSDSLLDERPFVVGLAAAAIAQLLASGDSGDVSSFSGAADAAATGAADSSSPVVFMLGRLADRAAQRLTAALGPVLEMCGQVPAPGQVAVCDMLLSLTRRSLCDTLRAASGLPGAGPPPPGVPVASLESLVAAVAAYLSTLLQSGDTAARTEACGAVLALAADLAAAGPAAAGAAAGLPQAMVLEAANALLQLQEREFMEAGLADMCEAVAAAVPALLPSARSQVLRALWPLAGRIADLPRRARIFSLAWRAAVGSELDYRTASGAAAAAAAPPPAPKAPSVSSDPMGMLGTLAAPAAAPAEAAGVVTAVPPSRRVAAQLAEPYMEALMAGRVPMAEADGVFVAAQAARTESGLSGASSITSSPSVTIGKPAKPEKEKKGGVLGGLFSRGKSKAKGDAAAAERGADLAEGAAAEAAAAAARQEAAAREAAAARTAPSPSPSPRGPGSSIAPPAAKAAPSVVDWGALGGLRSTPHATLRHELLQCLLQQLAAHPAAASAGELCAQHAAAVRHDRHPPTHAPGAGGVAASASATAATQRLGAAAQWVAMTSEVLAASAQCVSWEPYVLPAISAQPSVAAQGRAPIDFNVLTADLWLALLQAAAQAARSCQAVLRRLLEEAAEAAAAAAAAGAGQQLSYLGMGYGVPYGMSPGAAAALGQGQAQGSQSPEAAAEAHYRALLSYLDERTTVLQSLMTTLLSTWSSLSAAARPRVAWVAAHCLALPGHWDDAWAALTAALESLLLRGTDTLAAARRADIMGSALAGNLFKAGRQAWADPSRSFLFDIAAASALCETPEYEAVQVLAALAGLQHAAGRLTNAVAEAVPHGSAGAVHGQAAAVAKRLEAVLRAFAGTEAASAPHVRDWCKRITRSLAALIAFTPPVQLPATVAALGLIVKQAHEADGTAANAAADDDSSSDASSVYQPNNDDDGEVQERATLPPALAAAAAAAVAAATAAASGKPQAADAAAAANGDAHANGTAGVAAAATDGGAATAEAGRPRMQSGLSSSYLVHSAVAAVPMWGYPFAPLSSSSLQNSKRARRHRALLQHLAAAGAAAAAPRPALAAALRPLAAPGEEGAAALAGPALSSRTQYRLDSEAFWASLQPGRSLWQELTGPADPLLLRGCCVRPDAAAAGRGDPTTITVVLSAVNRLPVELGDAVLTLKASGHLLPTARRAATWELPRLAPHDRAATSFKFKVLGYGDLQLQARLQLCQGPARVDTAPLQLNCAPLELPVAVLLRPPPVPQTAAEFFRTWGTLPSRAELSGVCTWPGPEGGALLVSALLRQPLGCASLSHVPAVAGFQAAFSAVTALDDSLALVLTTQLMPPVVPGGSSESYFSIAVRSSSPDLILSLQAGAASWLSSVSTGAASLGSSGRTAHPSPAAKPPLHPRVAALLQAYAASAAQLAVSGGAGAGLTSFSSFGLPADGAAGGGAGAGLGGPTGRSPGGREASGAWLKNAALAEWQRLNSLPVV
ncbi:hypothetical protein GPECTOR_94g652 [Gonium pectorale]|uniref:Uncharacterized protein n=1 Tax=Gonium pectorale TaxID=33097 RepID=A0A150G200_GONPE|nr:hypothetical protein GPECTOR_94g652 [Gonium pectorale]|eukprot:KXZ43330.1 hypothetical protein GPECTOR_94g652 [Gonium pectorale]